MKPKTRQSARRRKRPPRRALAASSGPVSFVLADVARAVGGHVVGDPGLRLSGVETLERAAAQDLSWVADEHHARHVLSSRAGALLVAREADASGKPAVVVASPALALAQWLAVARPLVRPRPGVCSRANVHPSALLGRGLCIASGATVGARARIGDRVILCAGTFVGEEAEIGEDCILYPNAVVLDRCRVGARSVLHAGAVVGSDGFGYVWDGEQHRKIPQVGIVRVEEDVEIGANAAIDRATLGETVIGRGAKIDNLVQIGHNVVVGQHAVLCGQAGIGGSSRIGARAILAGQVGVSDHATVGEGATLTGQAGIARRAEVAPGAVVSGMPAAPHRDFLRSAALFARLPELVHRLEELERRAGSAPKGERPWKSESPKS
ncbi:MAG: UDP-3-O-(3-hydroxymyristoyl)glucosamine N-acyltransferase [Thermoanaerobaculia bacterium]